MIKKLLTISTVAGGIYLATKFYKNTDALNDLKAKIVSIKDVSINSQRIQLKLDILLSNNSKSDLGISSFKLLKIKQIQFFNRQNNSLVGVADVEISGLQIEAEKSFTLKDIVATIPVKSLLSNIQMFTGNTNENLKIVLILDSLGTTYTLDSDNFS